MIASLDHLVLTVADIDATVAFYTGILGMKAQPFGEGRLALTFGDQKINLHRVGHEFEPKARTALPGTADLCLLLSVTLEDAMARIAAAGISLVEGPVPKIGATGPLRSVYIRDPDGNLIELSVLDTGDGDLR